MRCVDALKLFLNLNEVCLSWPFQFLPQSQRHFFQVHYFDGNYFRHIWSLYFQEGKWHLSFCLISVYIENFLSKGYISLLIPPWAFRFANSALARSLLALCNLPRRCHSSRIFWKYVRTYNAKESCMQLRWKHSQFLKYLFYVYNWFRPKRNIIFHS